jgi:uncharacterized protein (DUF58 family)
METLEIIRRVRKIELRNRTLVEGLVAGAYHSIFKGRGIEFSEVREYAAGDDIRAIDWNVTARLNAPYVKEFIEERDLSVYILFDCSSSGSFGSSRQKLETGAELAASLMFAALRNNDNIGLLLFTGKVERFFPARKGKRHVLSLLSNMIKFRPGSDGTDLSHPLRFISRVARKRSIIFIISDFIAPDNYEKELRILKRRHQITAIRIQDPHEAGLPDVGYIELEDEETGEQILVDTSDSGFRERYSKIIAERDSKTFRMMRKAGIDSLQVVSGEDAQGVLCRHFRRRR